jgi:shikimate kinase
MTTEPTASTRPLWLVGLMGSGKSTVGRAVAQATRRSYLDNDTTIALLAGRTTEELARVGGSLLHDWEATYVRHVAALHHLVVAGIPASAADRAADLALLERRGLLVYIRCRPKVLAARVLTDPPRPWLNTTSDGIERILRKMYDARDATLRAAAHLSLDGESSVPALVSDLLTALDRET